MEQGKLSSGDLKRLILEKLQNSRKELLVEPHIGEDCAVLDFGDHVCVLSTDPITGAEKDAGSLAVQVSANDVASCGVEPMAMMVTFLVPPDADMEAVEHTIEDLIATAKQLNIAIAGGHTEITDAVNRIVVSTTVLGKSERQNVVLSAGAKPGDAIILTGYAAREGTKILLSDYKDQLEQVLDDEERTQGKALVEDLSVVREGLIGAKNGASAMHDATECGVIGAVFEMCEASGTGAYLEEEQIPVHSITQKIADALGVDPLKLIASGSMLVCIGQSDKQRLLDAYGEAGILASEIGTMAQESGVYSLKGNIAVEMTRPLRDELFRLNEIKYAQKGK